MHILKRSHVSVFFMINFSKSQKQLILREICPQKSVILIPFYAILRLFLTNFVQN